MRYLPALFVLAALSLNSTVYAEEETEHSVRFSEKLNEMRLFDWSVDLLNREIAKKPADVDLLKIQLASTYFKDNKSEQGNKIIAQITPTSPYYGVAQKELGVIAYTSSDFNDAARYLENYRSYVKKAYEKKIPSRDELGNIEGNLYYLVMLYKEHIPNRPKLIEVMRDIASLKSRFNDEVIRKLPPTEAIPDDIESTSATMYNMYRDLADMFERDKKEGKAISNIDVQKLIKDGNSGLEPTLWISPADYRDRCAMQIARCHILKGDLPAAEKVFKMYKNNIEEWDVADPETGKKPYEGDNVGASPKADYRHYFGLYNFELGKQKLAKKDVEGAKKAFGVALNQWLLLLRDFKGYHAQDAVLVLFDDLNEKILPPIVDKVPVDPKNPILMAYRITDAVTDRAKRLYREKKYAETIPLLLKGYAGRPNCKTAEDALMMLADCYANTGDWLLAQACADLMAYRFPKSDVTAQVVLYVGSSTWRDAEKLPATDVNRKNMMENGRRLLGIFLTLFPSHENAPNIAFSIAKAANDQAVELVKQGIAETAPLKKIELFESAKAFYLEAADRYQLVIEKFAQKQDLVSNAYYARGAALTSADEFAESTKALRKFCEIEDKAVDKLATAKFLIADNYYREASTSEKRAKELTAKTASLSAENAAKYLDEIKSLNELSVKDYNQAAKEHTELTESFYTGKLKLSTDPKVLARVLSSKEYIGWSYDCAGEKTKAIRAFQNYLTYVKKPPISNSKDLKATAEKRVPPILFRTFMLFNEIKDNVNAERYLTELKTQYPNSEEALSSNFLLGKSQYTIRKYEDACKTFNEMLDSKQGRISDWYWISNNLIRFEDEDKPSTPEMGAVAAKAGVLMLADLDNKPKMTDWFSPADVKSWKGKKDVINQNIYIVKERTWLGLGKAYMISKDFGNAVKMFTNLIEPPINRTRKDRKNQYTSPYYYDGLMFRARAYLGNNQPNEAHGDIGQLMTHSGSVGRYDIQRKAICENADLYIAQKKYDDCRRFLEVYVLQGKLNDRAELNIPEDATPAQRQYLEESAETQYQSEMQSVEYMCWKYAECAARLGLKDKVAEIQARYKEAFGKGRYGDQMQNLPPAEAANMP